MRLGISTANHIRLPFRSKDSHFAEWESFFVQHERILMGESPQRALIAGITILESI